MGLRAKNVNVIRIVSKNMENAKANELSSYQSSVVVTNDASDVIMRLVCVMFWYWTPFKRNKRK